MKGQFSSRRCGMIIKRCVSPEIKNCTLLIIIALCLFFFHCSKETGIDMIGMDKGKLEEKLAYTPDNTLRVDILNELAYRYSWDGGQKPHKYVDDAINLAEKLGYRRGLVDALNNLGQIHFMNGDFEESKKACEEGLELAKKIGFRTGEAMAFNGIARYYQLRGRYKLALQNFRKSVDICIKSSAKIDKRILARAYYGLGALHYYDPVDYQEAKKYFEKHLDLGKDINDIVIVTSGYYAIGEMYRGLEEFEKAKENFDACRKSSERIGLIYNQANAHEGLGDLFFDLGQYDKSLEHLIKSHKLFLKTGNKFQVAESKSRLGKLYNKMGEIYKNREHHKKAYGYLFLALEIAQITRIPKTIERVCEEIAGSCVKLGDYRDASQYYRLLLEKKEFLKINEMLKLKQIIDSEKKAEEERITRISLIRIFVGLSIALIIVLVILLKLRKKKKELEESYKNVEQLSQRLATALENEMEMSNLKDDLMHTVAHQYKSPLAIIHSSTQILKDYMSRLSRQEVKGHLKIILSNIEAMTHLIDQLLKFGRRFSPRDCDMVSIINKFIEDISDNEGKNCTILFNSSGDSCMVNVDRDFINIILHNLVVNSIKYSPEGSAIRLKLQCDDENAVIQVADQGIGIPGDYLKTPFERFFRGSNVKAIAGTGLGLAIVKRYTELHGGEVFIQSELHKGTTVTVRIPKEQKS